MEEVQSGEPVLRLGDVIMKGRRVETRSKFLVLQILPTKKNARSNSLKQHHQVVCKAVFSSVTVFGQGRVIKRKRNDNNDGAAVGRESINDDNDDDDAMPAAWNHYGGSARAVDGSMGRCKQARTDISSYYKPSRTTDATVPSDEETDRSVSVRDEDGALPPPPRRRIVPSRASRGKRISSVEEKKELQSWLASHASDKAKALGDFAWALLSSTEFFVNH